MDKWSPAQSPPDFRILFEAAPDAMMVVHENGLIVLINTRMEALSGYKREELIGLPVEALIPECCTATEAMQTSACCHAAAALNTEDGVTATLTDERGTRIPIEINSSSLNGIGHQAIIATVRDITRRHAMEEALRHSEMRLREAQSVASIGCWELDLIRDELYWSDEIYRIFELDPAALPATYQEFLQSVHPDDRKLVADTFNQSVKRQEPYSVEHRLLMPDGRIKYVHERGLTHYNDDGDPIRSVGTVQDVTERRRAEDKIEFLALYDPLTRLPNRRLLIDRLQRFISGSLHSGSRCAFLIIELCGLKIINDTLGHTSGDRLLIQAAKRIKAIIRESDIAARLSGDEYAVVLDELTTDLDSAAASTLSISSNILHSLSQPFDLDGVQRFIRPRIGVTLFSGDIHTPEELMKQADLALEQAKYAKTNGIRLFDPEMKAAIDRRATLETALREALERHEIVAYYQPQFDRNNRITGAEALARWHDPKRGLVTPDEFIHLAEHTELIRPLGQTILRQVCAWLAGPTGSSTRPGFTVAVNISVHHFHDRDFVEQVTNVLEETGADPRKLQLEVTESLLLENMEETVAKMEALKGRGITFSLDDFGTGYSSLAYLRELPLDLIKVDQSFVHGTVINSYDAAIVKAIIGLAKSMQLTVIAEGVESEEIRDYLEQLGCSVFQGFLLSPAVPAEKFEDLL